MKERNDYAAAPAGFGDAADELWRAIIEGAARRDAVAAAVALGLPRGPPCVFQALRLRIQVRLLSCFEGLSPPNLR